MLAETAKSSSQVQLKALRRSEEGKESFADPPKPSFEADAAQFLVKEV
jgi:hypothetical protein